MTGDFTTSLNPTALTLLGIAAATHLGSAAVDASKNNPSELAAQQAARTSLTALQGAGPPDPDRAAKLSKLQGESQCWLIDV
jgi:hypothetical protein